MNILIHRLGGSFSELNLNKLVKRSLSVHNLMAVVVTGDSVSERASIMSTVSPGRGMHSGASSSGSLLNPSAFA